MSAARKALLEDLLRNRRLQSETPPLAGEARPGARLRTGIAAVDASLGGGFPCGRLSEVFGPASSGRTGVTLAAVARSTRGGGLGAWLDAGDRLDPASAAQAGVDLSRLLWLRGDSRRLTLSRILAAAGTLVGSGLFEVVVLDVAGRAGAEARRLPAATWIRLQRLIEQQPTAVVLLSEAHLACGPGGVSLALASGAPSFSGAPGPGRLLGALAGTGRAGRTAAGGFLLQAFA